VTPWKGGKLLRACQAFTGVREKASRYPNTL
jgi:hypothetical protein